MPWNFPILKMLGSIFSPPQEPELDDGVPRPSIPPQVHPNDPGYEYEMHGTYANKYGNSYNVVYWPDFDAWSFHHIATAKSMLGHSTT